MRRNDWTKVLGWPGYEVYQHEIDEEQKRIKLWVRRKRGNRWLVCSGCGRKIGEPADVTQREVRDLPCFEYKTTVAIELYRVRCPDYGLKIERVPQLPSKAPFSKRFEEAVEACESASTRPVPTKTIELLAVDVKEEGDIIPTDNGAEGFIKFVEMERVWHSGDADDHGTHIARGPLEESIA